MTASSGGFTEGLEVQPPRGLKTYNPANSTRTNFNQNLKAGNRTLPVQIQSIKLTFPWIRFPLTFFYIKAPPPE